MRFLNRAAAFAIAAVVVSAAPALAQRSFWEFESGQVRPLAMSSDGTKLYAVNTPRNKLEVLTVGSGGLSPQASVPVGLEPVAVAVRPNSTQVWVVNHLSDSISIVDTASAPPRVVRTLLVGDEPRDIVFAGTNYSRAFITTAHRGQNIGFDPKLTTAGTGRSDVWVFDATNLGTSLGGTPVTVLSLFGDTPRPLAVSPNGQTVYAGVFESGNQTTSINEGVVCNGGASASSCSVRGVTYPGGLPAPNADTAGEAAPETGLIVKYNGTHWVDTLGRNWDNAVKFSLPDNDVFAINATASPPTQASAFQHVGTVLFNMAVNPVSGKLYVSNTDARNEVRFEGPGGGGSTVQGHLAESRITVISGSTVTPIHLNKHINYSVRPAPAGVAANSLATPTGIAVSSDGAKLYVAAFGSSKVGVFDTATLENNTFTPSAANHVAVSGGGPSGLALDEARNRLYVMTRFDDSISVVDLATKTEVQHLGLANPEPASITTGRRFLYDATSTSSNGESSCSSCHIFGDFDSLAWDLGNPDDVKKTNPMPINLGQFATIGLGQIVAEKNFHPMKGPMTTQSLRGLANQGAMHWRGDRSVGVFGTNATDENLSFNNFIVAFEGLVGSNPGAVSNAQMQQFTDFQLQVVYPPNPNRNLDNSLNSTQTAGRNFFFGNVGLIRPHRVDGLAVDITGGTDGFTCEGCHELDRAEGEFGTSTNGSFENEPQVIKVAHLRNVYQKIGMFGMPGVNEILSGDNGSKGAQVRGFGILHDGSIDTVFRFFRANVFAGQFPATGTGFDLLLGDIQRRQVEQYVLAFDSNLAPIVGQQVTLTNTNSSTVSSRISLLIARARTSFTMVEDPTAHECDLVVKGNIAGAQRSWLLNASTGNFTPDNGGAAVTDAQLRALAATAGQELTYTCVPPGSGTRIAFQS
jgi:DNA-binding beta-propeller fold protein YncE